MAVDSDNVKKFARAIHPLEQSRVSAPRFLRVVECKTSDHAWARGIRVFRGSLLLTHMVPSAGHLDAVRFPPPPRGCDADRCGRGTLTEGRRYSPSLLSPTRSLLQTAAAAAAVAHRSARLMRAGIRSCYLLLLPVRFQPDLRPKCPFRRGTESRWSDGTNARVFLWPSECCGCWICPSQRTIRLSAVPLEN